MQVRVLLGRPKTLPKRIPKVVKPREVTEDELSSLIECLRLDGGSLYWRKSTCNNVKAGDKAGSLYKTTGYRHVGLRGRLYKEHRVIYYLHTGVWPGKLQVDHINGVRDDNRPENLRLVTRKENARSYRVQKVGNTSKYRGVFLKGASGKWVTDIREGKKKRHLGCFDQEKEAALIWNLKAVELGYNPEAYNQVYGD